MADLRSDYTDFKDKYSDETAVFNELATYGIDEETSLKVPFLSACFNKIAPDYDWREVAETHHNYADWWGPQKIAATALKIVMNRQIGWPFHKGILSMEWEYLVGILFAVEMQGEVAWSEDHVPVTLPSELDEDLYCEELPSRARHELDLPTLFTFSDSVENEAIRLLKSRGIDPGHGQHHVVYVIDCTPPIDDEAEEITSIRRYVQAKRMGGYPIKGVNEEAALHLNESGCLLYVGYSNNFPERMLGHFKGVSSGAARFLNLYKPKYLLDVKEYETEGKAQDMEVSRASVLRVKMCCYVYQN